MTVCFNKKWAFKYIIYFRILSVIPVSSDTVKAPTSKMLCSRIVVFHPVVALKEGRNDPPTSVRPAECWSGPWPHNLNCKLVVVMWTVCFHFPIPTWRATARTSMLQYTKLSILLTTMRMQGKMQKILIVWKCFLKKSHDIVWQLDLLVKISSM